MVYALVEKGYLSSLLRGLFIGFGTDVNLGDVKNDIG